MAKFKLSKEERSSLRSLLKKGIHRSVELMRARVLLQLDLGEKKKSIAQDESICYSTVFNVQRRYLQGGLDRALYDAPRSGKPSQITAEQRAKITALACSKPPEGHQRWTLRLLADRAVEFQFVEEISHEKIRDILKKTH